MSRVLLLHFLVAGCSTHGWSLESHRDHTFLFSEIKFEPLKLAYPVQAWIDMTILVRSAQENHGTWRSPVESNAMHLRWQTSSLLVQWNFGDQKRAGELENRRKIVRLQQKLCKFPNQLSLCHLSGFENSNFECGGCQNVVELIVLESWWLVRNRCSGEIEFLGLALVQLIWTLIKSRRSRNYELDFLAVARNCGSFRISWSGVN